MAIELKYPSFSRSHLVDELDELLSVLLFLSGILLDLAAIQNPLELVVKMVLCLGGLFWIVGFNSTLHKSSC